MTNLIVVIGAGSIGQATARRANAGKHVLPADQRQDNVDAAAKVLSDAGFEVSTAIASSTTSTVFPRSRSRMSVSRSLRWPRA